ncbi:MAG TPA: hypothetical protein VJA17_03360 [Candidatus Omnitrophota bacterium]|nr:hypothetical protein [Candidatus Omnitrophota bacterium]
MYYLAKLTQAAGLGVITVGFLKNFPNLIDRNILLAGVVLFGLGWLIQAFLLKE